MIALFVGALFLLWSLPSLLGLASHWQTASIEHGYAPVLMALALAIRQLRRSVPIGRPSVIGIVVLIPLVVISSFSHAVSVQSVSQFLWPVCLYLTLLSLAGWRFANQFIPSIVFVYFAIPFWQDVYALFPGLPTLRDALQAATVITVSICVRLTGIPALIEGNFILLPAGTFEVAGSCSGLHYFIIAIELGLFYGFAFMESWRNRLVILFLMSGLAVVMNWIRVFSLIIIGFASEMQSSLVDDHSTFGWILFSVVLLPMFFIGDRHDSEAERNKPVVAVPGAQDYGRTRLVHVIIAVVLIAGITLNVKLSEPKRPDYAVREAQFPRLDGWQIERKWIDESRPVFLNIDEEAAVWLRQGSTRVGVFSGSYARQKQGAEAVNSANRPEGTSAERLSPATSVLVVSNDQAIPFREQEVIEAGARRLVWFSMKVAGTPVASPMRAKVLQALGRIRGRGDAQVIVVTKVCAANCTEAREELAEFAEETAASLFLINTPAE